MIVQYKAIYNTTINHSYLLQTRLYFNIANITTNFYWFYIQLDTQSNDIYTSILHLQI